MSALGKHVLDGDFDSNGQIVQAPAERVIERSVVVTRTQISAFPSRRRDNPLCLQSGIMPGLAHRAAINCRNHDGGKARPLGALSDDYP